MHKIRPDRLLQIATFIFSFFAKSQPVNYPKDYFRSPIDSAIILAGNFGEIRFNHLHSGWDIKTNSREGMKIMAVADGYVSRIKVSSFGFGKVVYVTHPNGYVSVYAHLKTFNDSIADYVKHKQYEAQSWDIELRPGADELKVTKGQLIAYSGNTGLSGGPHLHFEMRTEFPERSINPYNFSFPVKDNVKPIITRLRIYPANSSTKINGQNKYLNIKTVKGITTPASITVSGKFYIGFDAHDKENLSGGNNGIYIAQLKVDDHDIFQYEIDNIGFDETRSVNSLVDYSEEVSLNKITQRCYVEPNNSLKIYQHVIDMGQISFDDSKIHVISFTAKDYNNNLSEMHFNVRSELSKEIYLSLVDTASLFRYSKENTFKNTDVDLVFLANIFYDDMRFTYSVSKDTLPGCISPTHYIMSKNIPIHNAFCLRIKPCGIADSLLQHAVIVNISDKKGKSMVGGKWDGEYVSAECKYLGAFAVALDTIKPVIKFLKVTANTIEFKATDNLTGLRSFNCFIDDKWVPMEYEHKKNMLYYNFDEVFELSPFYKAKGGIKHSIRLIVTDIANNSTTYSSAFIR